MTTTAIHDGAKRGLRARLEAYTRPKVANMLMLGFSSGLPFMLTAATLGYWLREEGTSLAAIGFISWVGFAYSLKFVWAPLIDRVDAPLFGGLGRRRGWMLLAQIFVALALAAMAVVGPGHGLVLLGACALVVAASSATQDIVVDAWRIEAADNADEMGLLSSAYQLGYRAALLVADALILIAANHLGWPAAYMLMALLMSVGMIATWRAAEPIRADAVMDGRQALAPLTTFRGVFDAIAGPFIAFFRTHGSLALLMLGLISLYQIPQYVMAPMITPFYNDLGLSKDVVGGIRTSVGLVASLVGVAAGGFCAVRFGYMRTLIAGILLESLAVGIYAVLAYAHDLQTFAAVMAIDSFGLGFAGVALVTYMSSLTSLGYTATQYAVLSSTFSYLGKFVRGFSGVIVESLSQGRNLLDAYAIFFLGAGAVALPALILCLVLARVHPAKTP